MSKQDTAFGELIRAEAKRLYGEEFEFDKCTIERDWSIGADGKDEYLGYVVTFDITHDELGVSVIENDG